MKLLTTLLLICSTMFVQAQNVENDNVAAEVLKSAFPGLEIVGIDCRALIKQHGSLHCVTMQYPKAR